MQDAKNRLSEVVKRAQSEGPQTVTLRGRRAAVILSAEEYDALVGAKPSLVDHLLSGPAWDDELIEVIEVRANLRSGTPDAGILMFLVDTNVVAEAKRGGREAVGWLRSARPGAVYLSVITLREIMRGVEAKRRTDARAAAQLADWLQALRADYASRILPISDAVAIEWGRIAAGRTKGDADGMIAATAMAHKMTLVTRNVGDFDDLDLKIISPWGFSGA